MREVNYDPNLNVIAELILNWIKEVTSTYDGDEWVEEHLVMAIAYLDNSPHVSQRPLFWKPKLAITLLSFGEVSWKHRVLFEVIVDGVWGMEKQ